MRAVKIVLAAVAAVVALVVVAVIIVASTFDPNEYKGAVTDAFTARTGRALVIEQNLRLAYFPWLAVTTGGITIGSSAEFGGTAAPFVTATRVDARVRLLPLLARRLEIGTVVIEGLTLNLARDAEQRGNWQDLVEAVGADAPAEPAAPRAAAQPLAIAGVRIRDGSVYWRENVNDLRYSVTGLSLTTGEIGAGEPIAFDAALDFKDESSGLAAALELRAVVAAPAEGSVTATDVAANVTVRPGRGAASRTLGLTAARLAFDRDRQALAVEGLATETAGVRATWQLAGSTVVDNPTFEGSIAIDRAELAPALEELGLSPPQDVDSSELGTLTLTTRFAYRTEPPLIGVSELSAETLGMTVRGAGSLEGGNELAGTLEIPAFTPSGAAQAWLRAAVPPTVDISALGRLALSTRFDANVESGRAALRGFNLSAFGATIAADIEALPLERGNVFRASVTTSRFASEALVKGFAALLPPNLAASELGFIELDARFELDGATDTLTVAPLDVELFGLTASGEVTARNISTAAAWTGSARIAEFSPQDLLQRFGLPPQPTSDPAAFRRATVDTRFDATKDRAELSGLVLVIDETRITGRFALVGFERPAFRFDLAVDRVDADRYLPPKARDADAGERTAGDIELPQNNTMDLDGTMRVGALELAGMEFQDVGGRIVIGGGDLELEQARARLYGGTFDGNFTVRAAGNAPGLALDGRALGLELEPLITALTGEPANVSGTGSFDLKLAGTGRTVIENVQTAGGDVRFDMTNGAIQGFNLGYTLCRLYNLTQRAPAPAAQPAATAYEKIEGSAVVTAGTADSRDLLARTSFMDIGGNGTLQLAEQEMDYELDAMLTGSIGIAGCETLDRFVGGALPFEIEGTLTDPKISPDFSKLVLGAIGDEIKDRLQDRVRDRLRDLLR
jgi:AsmA protein